MNTRAIEWVRVPATVIGAGLVFAGERYFKSAAPHGWLVGGGFVFMAAGILSAALCGFRAKARGFSRELPTWRLALCWQSLIMSAFGIYFGYVKVMGSRPVPDSFPTKALLAAWVLCGVLGFFMGVGVEWAQMRNGRGDFSEPQRVRIASRGWLKIGILAVMIASIQYAAASRNATWDLSYLKTTKPSDSTLKMIAGLSQDVEVALFFPQGNEVLSHARLYFDNLTGKSARLSVSYQDVEISPLAGEKYKISRNGFAVLRSGEQIERFDIGVSLTAARKNLKNIDSEFQKSLLGVTEKRKNIYFTRGHGELSWSVGDEGSGLKSIKLLEGYLRSLNFSMRFFGVPEGSTKAVPADADAVVIIGGDQPFLPEEARVLQQYVEAGGKMLVMLDLDPPTSNAIDAGVRDAGRDPLVKWLADGVGIKYVPQILANMSNHIAATRSEADVWFLFSNVFTSHESVQSLSRNDQRIAVLTFRSGYFVTNEQVKDWRVVDTTRSLSDTFVDENRDFKFNEGRERREPRVIGAIAERKLDIKDPASPTARVAAFADASVVSDPMIRNQANLIYFVDALRWLVGDVKSSGVAASEEDVKIRHTTKEDAAWFYGTVVLVPALVLGIGAFANRRARRSVKGGGA